jgi:putative two-component system response regulator
MYKKIRPDLILLDLNMHHIDDFQIIEQLREVGKGFYAPILTLTTPLFRNIRFNALAGGGLGNFIEKNFDITEVVPRVFTMLKTRLLHNQARDQSQILEKKSRQEPADILKVYRPKGDTNRA